MRVPKKKVRVSNGRLNRKNTNPMIRSHMSWQTIGGKRYFFRSNLEVTYAKQLEVMKKGDFILDWLYEPQDFWFEEIRRGVRSYKPDFKVIELDGTHRWVEVKGYMDAKSLTKLKRFKKYYPNEPIEVWPNHPINELLKQPNPSPLDKNRRKPKDKANAEEEHGSDDE